MSPEEYMEYFLKRRLPPLSLSLEPSLPIDEASLRRDEEQHLLERELNDLAIEKLERAGKREYKKIQFDEKALQAAREELKRGGNELRFEAFNVEIRQKDLALLSPRQWLNDEIVNVFFELIEARAKRKDPGKPNLKIMILTSYFTVKFDRGYSYSSVRNWSKKRGFKLIEMDKVLIPIHVSGNHWCLAVINFIKKRFEYYDSMGGRNDTILGHLRNYVKDEAKLHSGQADYDMSEWVNYTPQDIPAQHNGYDCGVFACTYADYLSEDLPFTFTQEHIPNFRLKMVNDILSQKLL